MYQMKPIENDRELEDALDQYNSFFDALEGTAEAYKRDVLGILIEKYESETVPMELPDPISAIKFRMEQAGLTRKDLEPILGGKAKVSEILSGKRELTLKMARGLHTQLGIPAESLLGTPAILDDELGDMDFDRFPLVEMAKNGAFPDFDIQTIKNKAEEAIRSLVTLIGGPQAIPIGLFRKTNSTRLNAKLNRYALSGWCLQALAKSRAIEAPAYKPGALSNSFLSKLVRLSANKNGPKLAQEALREIGIVVVIVPHLKNTYLDGAAFMTSDGRPIIGLTLRYDKLDNFWFALFHELGHLALHLNDSKGSFLVDDLSLRNAQTDSDLEVQADQFAETHLLPNDFDLDTKEYLSTFDIISYAQEHGISPAIVVGRIQYTKRNYRIFANFLGRGEVSSLFNAS